MQRILTLFLTCALAGFPAHAQDNDGKSLMERGAELFLEGLRQEMEPTLEDLRGLADQMGPALRSFVQEMGPALAELTAQVQDWSIYEAPEILPNGDIIIRKKPQKAAPEDIDTQKAPSEGVTDI